MGVFHIYVFFGSVSYMGIQAIDENVGPIGPKIGITGEAIKTVFALLGTYKVVLNDRN